MSPILQVLMAVVFAIIFLNDIYGFLGAACSKIAKRLRGRVGHE